MTPYQALAIINGLTLSNIRLTLGVEVHRWEITDERIVLVLLTSRVKSTRHGWKVTHRGMRGYQWNKTCSGRYQAVEPLVVEWKLDTPIVYAHSTKTERERREAEAWAKMCYRPGNSAFPMDGPRGSNPSVR